MLVERAMSKKSKLNKKLIFAKLPISTGCDLNLEVSLGGKSRTAWRNGRGRSTSNGFLTITGYRVAVVEYGLNNVVAVAVLLVVACSVVVGSDEPVEVVVAGVSGGNSAAVELPVWVYDDVVVVVRRTLDDVVVADEVVTDGPDGWVECRDVCRTANTISTTAMTPAIPAATAVAGRSCH